MHTTVPCYWDACPTIRKHLAKVFWDALDEMVKKVPDAVTQHPMQAVQINADSLNRKLVEQTVGEFWMPHYYMVHGPFPSSIQINVQFICKYGLPLNGN